MAEMNAVTEQLRHNSEQQQEDAKENREVLSKIVGKFAEMFKRDDRSKLDALESQRDKDKKAKETLAPLAKVSAKDILSPSGILGVAGAGAVGAIVGLASAYANFYKDLFQRIAGGDKNGRKGFFGRMRTRILAPFKNFMIGFTKIGAEINAGVKGLKELKVSDFTTKMAKLGATLRLSLAGGILEPLTQLFKGITEPFKFLRDNLKQLGLGADKNPIVRAIGNFLNVFGRFLRFFVGIIGRVFSAPFVFAFNFIKELITGEGDIGQRIVNGLLEGVRGVLNFFIFDFVELITGGLRKVFEYFDLELGVKIINIFDKVVGKIGDAFNEAIDLLTGFVLGEDLNELANNSPTLQAFVEWLKLGWLRDGVAELFSFADNYVKESIIPKVKSIFDFVGELFDRLVQNVKNFIKDKFGIADDSEVQGNAFQDVNKADLSDEQKKFLKDRNQALQRIREENLQGDALKSRLDAINKMATEQGVAGMNYVDNSTGAVYQSSNSFIQDYSAATDDTDKKPN